ncbi:MAG: serine/threonine-protein kinase [Phycisphaerales bacterium]|nr:protein kinase [Planctomycetota bacterium]
MQPTRAQRLRELFDAAMERAPQERPAFLISRCPDDEPLRLQVAALLESLAASSPLDIDPALWFQQAAFDSRAAPTSAGPDVRTTIDEYRLIRPLGKGGISTVFEAEQLSVRRRVAFKILQSWSASPDARRRFVEEASILARLRHPAIAQVIAAGSHPLTFSGLDPLLAGGVLGDIRSLPWIAIELVEDARTIVQACLHAPVHHTLKLFAQVADAVHFGHQQGFIHRDLKPANILINSRGEPKIIDFGIARAIADTSAPARTTEGSLLGSPRYMSPEQCDTRIGPVDTRSDVYALGVVLFEALTGSPPHAGQDDSVAATIRAICEQNAPDPRARNPLIPRDAARVVLKALERNPADRYQSASELASDLRRVLASEPIAARPHSLVYLASMLLKRRPVVSALAAATLIGILAGLLGISFGLAREHAARREADRVARLANLTAADSFIRLGDGGSAVRRLQAIPADRRDWEWNYLSALADTSRDQWDLSKDPISAICSQSGRSIAVASDPSGVRFLDARTRSIQSDWPDLKIVGRIEWSSDDRLAALPQDTGVTVLDPLSRRVLTRFDNAPGAFPLASAFSPDRSCLAVSWSNMQGVEVFSLESGKRLFSQPSEGWVFHPDFTPDGKRFLWCDVSHLRIIDTATWTSAADIPIQRYSRFEPGGVTVSPDGSSAAVICGTFTQIIDLASGSVRAELRGHAQRVHSAVFDRAGERVLTSSIDRTIRLWNAKTGELLATLLGHEHPTFAAAFDQCPSQTTVLSLDEAGRVRTWDLRALGPIRQLSLGRSGEYIRQIIFQSQPGQLLATSKHAFARFDPQSGDPPSLTSPDALDMCILPGSAARAFCPDRQTVVLESLATRETLWRAPVDFTEGIFASPDGRLLAISEAQGNIAILRISDGKRLGTLAGDPIGNLRPQFSPDGSRLLCASITGIISLHDTNSCKLIAQIHGPGPHGHGVAFSSDGRSLAYCDAPDAVTIADSRTLAPSLHIPNVGGHVWSLAFSPDGRRLAVGAQDRITHIFELPTGDELLQLRNHTGSVVCLAWSPDGRYLATGGHDNRTFLYESSPAAAASLKNPPKAP